MFTMDTQPYDVWYDPNEIDETNHAQVLRAWARPDLEITFGKIVLLGDDEQEPVPARIVSFNEATDIITLEVLFNEQHTAVA
jgi:transcription elongation GreA/GreB family factor